MATPNKRELTKFLQRNYSSNKFWIFASKPIILILHLASPSLTVPVRKFEYNLEALRGLAALSVVLAHCFDFSEALNGTALYGIWKYNFPGHLAVLVFFILSGYVIGLSTKQALTWSTSRAYIKKRLLRLYPIYVLCLIIGILVSDRNYSITTILANFSFLQVAVTDVTYEVGVAWSLNYEMLFYLLFIPLSIYKIRTAYAISVSLVAAIFFQHIVSIPQVAMYSYGFCFWLTGLWLSQEKYSRPTVYSRYTLSGMFCLMLAFPLLNFAAEILRFKLHTNYFWGKPWDSPVAILFSDFSYLPIAVLLVSTFVNKRIPFRRVIMIFSVLVPFCFFLLQLKNSRIGLVDWQPQLVAYLLYALAIVLLSIGALRTPTFSKLFPKPLITLGSISYGLYLVHFLVIVLLGRMHMGYGSQATFIPRVLLVVALSFVAGYVLEKIWHPFAIRQLKRLRIFH